MSGWRLQPDQVQAVLVDVTERAEQLGAHLSESTFQSVLDGLTWGGALTSDVAASLNALLADQATHLTNIGNRIGAGTLGVANATLAYRDGQTEMAGTYQTELLRSATTGDFTFFAEHGQRG